MFELAAEEGDDGAGAAQDVAEADGDAAHGIVGVVEALDVHLGEALAGAHDAAGVHGLVGADEDHGGGTSGSGGVGDMAGAAGVGEEAFAGVGFHDGDVLEGGGVEDKVGADFVEDGADAGVVADIGDAGEAREGGVGLGDLEVDLPEGELAVVEQDELGRGEGCELSDQLGADGAAGAGDEDPAAADEAGHGFAVERELGAVEEVLNGDGGEFEGVALGAQEGGGAGGAADGDAFVVGHGEEAGEAGAGDVTIGDDDGVGEAAGGAEAGEDGGGFVDGAEDGLAVDAAAGLAFAAGEEADDAEALAAFAEFEGAEEEVGAFAGAGEEDGLGVGGGAGEAGAHAVEDARGAEGDDQDQCVDDREGGRGQREPGAGEEKREEDGAGDAAADDREEVVDAGEAPVLLWHAERQAGEEKGDGAAEDEPERAEEAAAGVGDVAGERGGDRGERAVHEDVQQDAVDAPGLRYGRGALRGHRSDPIAAFPPFRTPGRRAA